MFILSSGLSSEQPLSPYLIHCKWGSLKWELPWNRIVIAFWISAGLSAVRLMSIVKRPPSNKHTTVRCDAQVKKACSWPAAEGTVNIAITTREQGAKNVPKSEDDNEGAQNVGDNLSDRSQGTGLSHQRDYVTHKVINGVETTERQLRELYSGDRATKESKCLVKRQQIRWVMTVV